MQRRVRAVVLGGWVGLISGGAWALTTGDIAPNADISRIDADRAQSPIQYVEPGEDLPVIEPMPTTPLQKRPNLRFVLQQVIIESDHRLSTELAIPIADLKPFYAAYLGRNISLSDLDRIAQTIEAKYRAAGYLLTKVIVPPQRIDEQGIARLHIVQGHIDQVTVEGDIPSGLRQKLLDYGNALRHCQPLHTKTLQHYALMAKDLPGLHVKLVLSPAETLAGAAKLTFVARFNPLAKGHLDYNNRGTRFFGPHQLGVDVHIDALLDTPTQSGLRLYTTPNVKNMGTLEIYHHHWLSNYGLQLAESITLSSTRPGDSLAAANIKGSSRTMRFVLSQPIIRHQQRNLYLDGTFKWYDTKTRAFNSPLSEDRIRSIALGLNYDWRDAMRGSNRLRFSVSKGLNILNARQGHGPEMVGLSRAEGRSDFTKLNASLSHRQTFNPLLYFLVGFKGQVAMNPLLSSEQFGFGGGRFGQAFDGSIITGDSGWAGYIELLSHNIVPKQWPIPQLLKHSECFVFYDFGHIWNRDLTTQVRRASANSLGAGLRVYTQHHIQGNVIIAKGNGDTASQHDRHVFFNLTFALP